METGRYLSIRCTETGMTAPNSNSGPRNNAAPEVNYLSHFTKAGVGEAAACGISQLLQISSLRQMGCKPNRCRSLHSSAERLKNQRLRPDSCTST